MFTGFINFETFLFIVYRDRLVQIDLTNEEKEAIVYQQQLDDQIVDFSLVKRTPDYGNLDPTKAQNQESCFMVTTISNKLYVMEKENENMVLSKQKELKFGDNERIVKCKGEIKHGACVFYLTRSTNEGEKLVNKSEIQVGMNRFKNFDRFDKTKESKYNLYACSTDGKPQRLQDNDFFFKNRITEPDLVIFYAENDADDDQKDVIHLMFNKQEDGRKAAILKVYFFVDDNGVPSFNSDEKEVNFQLSSLDVGKLIGVVCAQGKDYGKSEGFIARITSECICVYSSFKDQNKFKFVLKNTRIVKTHLVDDVYMYCLQDQPGKYLLEKDGLPEIEAVGIYPQKQSAGVFLIDFKRLIKDAQIEILQLTKCVQGVNDQFKLSEDRISLLENFSYIQLLPLIHRNTINFVGMNEKSKYLIWREKNGFFSALHEDGHLHTWSVLSGEHLFEKKIDKNLRNAIDGFKIYQSGDSDDQYQRAHYNGRNSTIQLLYKDQVKHRIVLEDLNVNGGKVEKTVNEDIFADPKSVNISKEIEYAEYEFKVLELKMHQDFVDEKTCEKLVEVETVQELFHFTFYLSIRRKSDNSEEFEADGRLQLVLSQDTMKLMVIVENDTFCIYNRDQLTPSQGQKIIWKPIKECMHIKFPSLLQANMKANFLFDPTFEYFINCDYEKECFVVVRTNGEHYKDIPKDQISVVSKIEGKTLQVVINQAKKMFFSSKDTLEYITDDGLWVMLYIHDEGTDKNEMRVKRYSLMKNRQKKAPQNEQHSIIKPVKIAEEEVFERILRMGQWVEIKLERERYQEEQELKAWSARSKRDPVVKELVKESYQRTLLSSLYDIDHDEEKIFQAQASFTIQDWLIQDEVLNNKKINIENVDHNGRIQLCMNIFPERRTVLHYFVDNCFNQEEEETSVNNQDVVVTLFQTCAKGVTKTAHGVMKSNIPFEIPIIEDCYGRTPFDIALDVDSKHQQSQHFQEKKKKKGAPILKCGKKLGEFFGIKSKDKAKTSEMMAGILFACTKDYNFLHSAHMISEAIIKAVKSEVPGIGEYLEGRMKTPTNLPNLNQQPIRNSHEIVGHFMKLNELGQRTYTLYGAANMKVFCGRKEIEEKFFREDGATKLMEMLQIDIPHIFDPGHKQGTAFIKALNTTKEVDLFLKESVQAIINKHFSSYQVLCYLWLVIIIPYLFQLGVFITWTQVTLNKKTADEDNTDLGLEYALTASCIWFLLIELFKIQTHKLMYFTNPWNVMNLVPPTLILINIYGQDTRKQSTGESDEAYLGSQISFWDLQSMAALFLWGKFLYILRSFDKTGYLVRSLVEVTSDMWVFLLVLFIVILGYGDAFGNLSKAQDYYDQLENLPQSKPADAETNILSAEDNVSEVVNEPQGDRTLEELSDYQKAAQNYAKAIYYGLLQAKGNDFEDVPPFATIVFVSAYVLLVIVMMNLLIAIVSNTFGRVTSSSVQYSFKEKVGLISDIYAVLRLFTAPECCQNDRIQIEGSKTEFLFIVKEDAKNKEAIPEEEEAENDMSIDDKVDIIIEEVRLMKTTMANEQESCYQKIDEILRQLQSTNNPTRKQFESQKTSAAINKAFNAVQMPVGAFKSSSGNVVAERIEESPSERSSIEFE